MLEALDSFFGMLLNLFIFGMFLVGLSVRSFVRLSVCLSVYLSVCLLVSLPVYGGRGVGGQVRASAVRALQCVAPVGDSYAIDACLNKTHHHQWFVRASALEGLCLVCPSGDDRIIQVCPVSLSPRLICSCIALALARANSLSFLLTLSFSGDLA